MFANRFNLWYTVRIGSVREAMAGTTSNYFLWKSELKQDADGIVYAELTCQTDNTTENDNVDKYLFEVRRYKSVTTKEEYLTIKVYEAHRDQSGNIVKQNDTDTCAEINQVSIIDLERKLLDLRLYGVLLGRKQFPKIRQQIEQVYLSLGIHKVAQGTMVTDDVILAIYEMFVRYIREVGIEPRNDLYNIPVDEFKEYIADTEYSRYKYSDIRKGLAELQFEPNGRVMKATKCSFGRNDNTIAKGDKRIKVISFVKDTLDSYQITKLPEDI